MDETPAKYKATESTLDAATKYLELFATIEDGDRYKFFLAESEARSKLLTDETPMPVRRMIDKFVRSAFASFIKNRELVESKSAQEYERIQKEHADEIALLKEAHTAELRRLTETHSSELERFKEERKRQEENVVRRRGVVARRHVAGFVVSLFLVIYAVCMIEGAYDSAILTVGAIAATLGIDGVLHKAFGGGKDVATETGTTIPPA